jgi:transposase
MPRNGPSPFQRRKLDLKGALLTVMEQTWIINEVLLTGRSYSHMEERYNLPRATLCKWVKQFSETGRVMGKRGRPLRVDKDLIDALELSTTDQASAEN